MIIFPSSCAQRAAKISFYFVFPNAAAVLPSSFCYVLLPIHPTPLAWLPARVLGFTTAFRPRCRPGKESSQESGARASFWRQALARRGGGRHSKAYLHTLLFHFHTLPANALWKVPSEFPPGRTEGGGEGGTERDGGGERLGRNRRSQPDSLSASPWGRPPTPSGCGHRGRTRDPPPGRPRSTGLRGPARSASSGQDARAGLQPPPRKFWSGAGSQASCLYSPQPRGEIPRPAFTAQRPWRLFKCAQAEFRSEPQCNVRQK